MNTKRKSGEHLFVPCGGQPRCATCGCDEDDVYVGGEKCSFRSTPNRTLTMKNVSDQEAIERILKAIAQDDELIRQFAKVVGVSTKTFDKWIDTVKVPEAVPEKLFMVYRQATDEGGDSVDSFFAICANEDKAQAKIDDLTADFGPMGFAYRPVVLE